MKDKITKVEAENQQIKAENQLIRTELLQRIATLERHLKLMNSIAKR